jgi:hypothetical protein
MEPMALLAPVETAGGGLEAWVRRHQVCWEVGPYFEVHRDQKMQLGLSLTLLARPPTGGSLDPGREECAGVFEKLEEIVRRTIPPETRIHVEPYDAAFHLRPQTGWEPEVELTVEVLHREGTFEPIDESERGGLALIRKRLSELGLQEGTWDPRRAAGA